MTFVLYSSSLLTGSVFILPVCVPNHKLKATLSDGESRQWSSTERINLLSYKVMDVCGESKVRGTR